MQETLLPPCRRGNYNSGARPKQLHLRRVLRPPSSATTAGKAYCTYRLLRVHESAEHSQKAPKTDEVLFDRALHSLNGLPTCRLCHHVFRQWDNLKQHIRRKRCPCLRGSPTSMPHTETACEIQPMMGSDETAASLPTTELLCPWTPQVSPTLPLCSPHSTTGDATASASRSMGRAGK